ncbi:MAG: hypothetical protein LLF96_11025 [Eubacteriales bacterium]|nr:hypothetical protein [Eubacteriales bacterium]
MEIRTLTRPTRAEQTQTVAVLTESFWRTPLFHGFLFRGRKQPARTFLALLLRYALKAGRVYVAEEPGRGIVACALWTTPDTPELNIRNIFLLGLWPWAVLLALQSPVATLRICELFSVLNTFVPDMPCATLEYLASAEKGAGAALVRRGLKEFAGIPAYVESIVSKNDHAYYRQFGFKPFARKDFHDTDYALMLLSPGERNVG